MKPSNPTGKKIAKSAIASNTNKPGEKRESENQTSHIQATSNTERSIPPLAAKELPSKTNGLPKRTDEMNIERPSQNVGRSSGDRQREATTKHRENSFPKPVTQFASTVKSNGKKFHTKPAAKSLTSSKQDEKSHAVDTIPCLGKERKRSAPESTKINEPTSKRQRNQTAATGAYRAYYQRRVGDASAEQDDRLPLIQGVLEKMYKPTVLDIGCNDGTLTLKVGGLGASQVVGVEVDPDLVKRARKSLRDLVFAEKDSEKHRTIIDVPENDGKTGVNIDASEGSKNISRSAEDKFPFNVTFRCEDFAKGDGRSANEKGKYDVILCLSVTKWVHIVHGDEGLIRFFGAIRDCLKDDGCLILEPQLAKSYKLARKRGLAPDDLNVGNFKLKPNQFDRYLLTQGGFARMEKLRDLRKGQSFNRPIMAFYKTKSTGSAEATEEKEEKEVKV